MVKVQRRKDSSLFVGTFVFDNSFRASIGIYCALRRHIQANLGIQYYWDFIIRFLCTGVVRYNEYIFNLSGSNQLGEVNLRCSGKVCGQGEQEAIT